MRTASSRSPAFLTRSELGNGPSWADIVDGLALTGHFIETRLYTAHMRAPMRSRQRLVEEVRRMAKAEATP